MEFDAEDVMSRIARQLTSVSRTVDATEAGEIAVVTPVRSSDLPPIAVKTAFTLSELLGYADREFVLTAFSVVLRRRPDAEEMQQYLAELRSGRASKVEVLGALRWSDEGRARGVHIDGLLIPYTLQRWQRRPVLGPVLAWGHTFLRLGQISSRARQQDAAHDHALTAVADQTNQALLAIDARLHRIETIASQISAIHSHLRELGAANEAQAARVEDVERAIAGLAELAERVTDQERHIEQARGYAGRVEGAERAIVELGHHIAEHGHAVAQLEAHAVAHAEGIADVRSHVDIQRVAIAQLQDHMAGHAEGLASLHGVVVSHGAVIAEAQARQSVEDEGERGLDEFYDAFEKTFRGSEAVIRERMTPYIDLVRSASAGTPARPLLDIGCGSGEWLKLLREHGFVARGVDINALSVQRARADGLDVVQGNAIRYLESLPDASIGAVTAMHVVEHLPFDGLVKLVDQCRRVLTDGGLLVLETPNPENLLVASHYFYIDPTHRNPLPPQTLQWIVSVRGFDHVRVERLTHARAFEAPEMLPNDLPGAASINAVLALMRNALDYAVIGFKR